MSENAWKNYLVILPVELNRFLNFTLEFKTFSIWLLPIRVSPTNWFGLVTNSKIYKSYHPLLNLTGQRLDTSEFKMVGFE